MIKGENAPALGLDPVKGRIAGVFGHWEDAAGIAFKSTWGVISMVRLEGDPIVCGFAFVCYP